MKPIPFAVVNKLRVQRWSFHRNVIYTLVNSDLSVE